MLKARVEAISYYLPTARLNNEQLAVEYPGWSSEDIEAKVGIRSRPVAAEDEHTSDMAVCAAETLFREHNVSRSDIDFILLCTQSPDYVLPTTACIVQHRLNIPITAGALDFNLGCSGYVYGLGLAKGLIETGQARRLLLLTSEAYARLCKDRGTRAIFADGAAATLISAVEYDSEQMGPFVYGTDGSGWDRLVVRNGGSRSPIGARHLEMVGPDIFSFTIQSVPGLVRRTLAAAGLTEDQVDLYVFHQANAYMLEHLRKKVGIPQERFVLQIRDCGNTVSSTIPIALAELHTQGRLCGTVMLVGFGVGYSSAACILRM